MNTAVRLYPQNTLALSVEKNGYGSWGIYNHRIGGWHRMFAGDLPKAWSELSRILGEAEDEETEEQF